ncbi:putative capsid [uncultured virus]|uniref:Putative capsid n=1 Tax=uncultured virus TaxID=340016 RepID=A0A2K9LS89_9VIRU|nr:putative capsid [uncultured virus]
MNKFIFPGNRTNSINFGFKPTPLKIIFFLSTDGVHQQTLQEAMRRRRGYRKYGRKRRKLRGYRRVYRKTGRYKGRFGGRNRYIGKSRKILGLFKYITFRKFRYRIRAYLELSALVPNTYFLLRGNGPYDPEQAPLGGQPFDWPAVNTYYTNYICYGSKLRCKFYATNNVAVYRIYVKPQVTTVGPSIGTINSEKFTTTRVLGHASGGKCSTSFSRYCSSRFMLQRSPQTDENQVSLVNGLPASQWYWLVGCDNLNVNATGQTDVIPIELTIDYYCKLYNQTGDTF